jgi:hypothetical protein
MDKFTIDPKNISVVVQGPVVGQGESDPNKQFTRRSLQSVRRILPYAQLILSTWRGADISGLDYDVLLLNDEPERIEMIWPGGGPQQQTANLQIISTRNGLEKADRKYAMKLRADTILTGTGFMKYFIKYNRYSDSDILENKVVVLPTYNPRKKTRLLFDVCDWFFFGLTCDVKNIFNIPLLDKHQFPGREVNGKYLLTEFVGTEPYIWTSFLRKHQILDFPRFDYFSESSLRASEESYAKHTIMVPASRLNIVCLKMPGAGYGARPFLSQGLYTFNDYIKLYNEHNGHKAFYLPNPLEDFIYFMMFSIRLLVQKINANFYKSIVNFIRKLHGSSNLLK